ncbi:MAG: SEC-C domain-containing protein [Chloroflexi bacterium]|nr:SEC-C domain-containing protein [Chloroflexota bacterium]
MASAAQIQANRANALASTGPRTPEGKAASSRNAVRHGLYASLDSLAPAEREHFDQIYSHFSARYPSPESEQTLHDLAFAWFRRERVRRMEAAWIAAQIAHFASLFPDATHDRILAQLLISDGKQDNFISRLHRWDRSLTRDIDRALNSLNQHHKTASAEAENEIVETKPNAPAQASRNAPCPCGSGLKYKRCCLPVHQQAVSAAKITPMPRPEPTAAGPALP